VVTSVAFVIPAFGRLDVSAFAFAGIRWTLDELGDKGVDAAAVVVADDGNLELAAEHGLEPLERPNSPLGAKWNDGYEHALRGGADFVIACGSDDWVHPDLIMAHLAAHDQHVPWPIHCSRRSVVIAPSGREAVAITVGYHGGDGVRMIPRRTLEPLAFRPTIDQRERAIDGGMSMKFMQAGVKVEWTYTDLHPFQIVDFKSAANLTDYSLFPTCEHAPELIDEPLAQLAEHYPSHLVELASAFHDRAMVGAH
jgi:glycosyltransferase involved in cell wall biosynthesis